MKLRASQLAREFGKEKKDVIALVQEKLSSEMWKWFGKDVWISEEGIPIIEAALDVPEIVPKHVVGYVLRVAPNPRFVYCQLSETKEVVPVLIPRKMGKRLKGKRITIEVIEDADGATYRRVPVPGVG